MSTMDARHQEYINFQVENTRGKIRAVAEKFRRVADEIEREADFKEGASSSAVANVVRHIHWGVANANINGLMDAEHRIQEAKDAAATLARENAPT